MVFHDGDLHYKCISSCFERVQVWLQSSTLRAGLGQEEQPNPTNYVGYFFSKWSGLVILIRIFIYFHLKLIQSVILSLLRWNYGLDIMKALPPIFDIMKILYRGPEFAHSSCLIFLKILSNLCSTNKNTPFHITCHI